MLWVDFTIEFISFAVHVTELRGLDCVQCMNVCRTVSPVWWHVMKRVVARSESPACECGRAAALLVRGRRLLRLVDVQSVQSPAALCRTTFILQLCCL